MSVNNTIESGPTKPETTVYSQTLQAQLASTVQSFLAGGCALLALGTIGFILYTTENYKALFSKKNALLIALLMSATIFFGFASIETDGGNRVSSLLRTIFFATTEISFICYSWVRSEVVFRQESSPFAVQFFQIMAAVTSVACVVPVIIVAIPIDDRDAFNASRIALCISGFGVFVIDVYFAYAYTRHIFKRTEEVKQVKGEDSRATQYYPIIAKFGFAASASIFLAIAFYASATAFRAKTVMSMADSATYYFLIVLTNMAIFSGCIALVVMKVKLVNASKKEAPGRGGGI